MNNFMITASGRWVDLSHIKSEDIIATDIARSLSNLCRFNGQINKHYSVAAHSLAVAKIVNRGLKKAAIVHDAAESFTSDIIRPFKQGLTFNGESIYDIEARILKKICEKFNVPYNNLRHIVKYDDAILGAEFILLRNFSGVTPNKEVFKPTISAIKAVAHYSSLSSDVIFNEFLEALMKGV